MKNIRNLAAVAITFAVLLLTPSFSAAQDPRVLTKKELVTLLKTAKEPPDHLQIAAYYTQEAARLRGEAKEHSERATIYEQTREFAAMESKHGDAWGQGVSHCKKFAQLALDRAKETDALARPGW